ncbi:MAG TPA: hypothetical protein VNW29_07945, partial [Candidatus Sulfotelmatobacter sp.]|nr:hypothetical protein [Candidatus Sulfotelmatobacter sp.]
MKKFITFLSSLIFFFVILSVSSSSVFASGNYAVSFPPNVKLEPTTDAATLEMWVKLSQTQGLTSLITKEVPNKEGLVMNISPNGT